MDRRGKKMPNTLADFPPDRFAIYAYCSCGHESKVDTTALPQDLQMDTLHARLRCSACGGSDVQIRIVWTAAGGYAHSD